MCPKATEDICKHLSAHQKMNGRAHYGAGMLPGEKRPELTPWQLLSCIVPCERGQAQRVRAPRFHAWDAPKDRSLVTESKPLIAGVGRVLTTMEQRIDGNTCYLFGVMEMSQIWIVAVVTGL